MKEEVDCACEFLCSNIRSAKTAGGTLNEEQLKTFRTVLKGLIVNKFTNHWYPEKPMRGNGFRCVNIDKDTKVVDPMITKAAKVSDISKDVFLSAFRFGLALWVDPGDVSYRTGNSHSSNVVSLYKTTTNCTPLPINRYQLAASNSQRKPMYTNGFVANGLNRQWKNGNLFSYPQLTGKQLKQILQQRRNVDHFHWTNANYVPQQVTEVY